MNTEETCGWKEDLQTFPLGEDKINEEKDRMTRLVLKAKKKDVDAFSLLYEMVYKDMYCMALYTLGNSHDAEDVVSDTVLDAYKQIHSLRDETAFRGWIFRILSNKCNQKLREYVRKKGQETQGELTETKDEIRSAQMENILDRQLISTAFSVLEQQDRLIVTMVIYGGYNSKEIGKILHKNSSTIRSRYRRALEKMKQVIC